MDEIPYVEMTPTQQRVLIDASQAFEAYRQALATWGRYEGGMAWKTVKGRDYLIKVVNRRGGTKSLGPRTADNERIFTEFVEGKAGAKQRLEAAQGVLEEIAGMCRGVRINRVPSVVTAILRKLDSVGLLEKSLMVIGTHALYGYEASAGVIAYSGDLDRLFRPNVTGHSAGSALRGFITPSGHVPSTPAALWSALGLPASRRSRRGV